MKLYQIVEITGKNNDAGTKATQDAAQIAEKMGFIPVPIKMCTTRDSKVAKLERQIGYWMDWKKAYQSIEKEAVVLLQNPFHHQQLTREKMLRELKADKKAKYISLVHDVEELRKFRYSDYYRHEFDIMMELADVLIVHNEKMADFFRMRGVSEEKLVVLEIFDYLQDLREHSTPKFEQKLIVAGNLDTKKCGYIGQLSQLKKVDIQLYGPNFDPKMRNCANIRYGGSLAPDEVPEKLTGGFGLVWDGDSIDGCQGDAGQYLKYNNPHKLSLYLSSGLPVVIWSGAAEADFVKKNKVGVTVDSLYQLSARMEKMTAQQYAEYAQNAEKLAEKLRAGFYLKKALTEAMDKIRG